MISVCVFHCADTNIVNLHAYWHYDTVTALQSEQQMFTVGSCISPLVLDCFGFVFFFCKKMGKKTKNKSKLEQRDWISDAAAVSLVLLDPPQNARSLHTRLMTTSLCFLIWVCSLIIPPCLYFALFPKPCALKDDRIPSVSRIIRQS